MKHIFPIPILTLTLLSQMLGCRGQPTITEPHEVETRHVVVASIDPPVPAGSSEYRLVRVELSREDGDPLAGHLSAALSAEPASIETIIYGLAQPDLCRSAARSIAFLPREIASRPLWLALRTDCGAQIAIEAAEVLGLENLVERARELDEIPRPGQEQPQSTGEDIECKPLFDEIRSLSPEATTLPASLSRFEELEWRLPESDEDLCSDRSVTAALRLRRGDRLARLAFDLVLDETDVLPEHLVTFILYAGLGGASGRLASRIGEADGDICAALIEAGRFENVAEQLESSPEDLPFCLDTAVSALREQPFERAQPILQSIARSGLHRDCEQGAMRAVLTLIENEQTPPRWTSDPIYLGRGLATIFSDFSLSELKQLAFQFYQFPEQQEQEGPIQLLQRDLHTILPATSGPRTAALRNILTIGYR